MTSPPAKPCIYHITHVDNLESIVSDGFLISDAAMIPRGGPKAAVGMSKIKKRRLKLPIAGHTGLCVGDCVPFYFCPRSVMLYLLHMGNHPEVSYRDGQQPIVHLQADLQSSLAWLDAAPQRWAVSLSNASAYAAEFRADRAGLGDIDWDAIENTDFRDSGVRERKQAEFLAEHSFPWSLIHRIGVRSSKVAKRVEGIIGGTSHSPVVTVERGWYY